MRRKPIFETLEPRLLLSADLAPVEGVLEVVGTNESDFAFITARQERLLVELNGKAYEFALEDVKEIRVDLGEGDNRFEADLLNPVGLLSVVAGSGNDVIVAKAQWDGLRTSHPDFLWLPTFNPGAGDDSVHADWSSVDSFSLGEGTAGVAACILAGDGNDVIAFDLSRLLVGATRSPVIQLDLDDGLGDDVVRVTNPTAAEGGDDREPIDPAERRAPVSLRHDGRAGTDSFELLGGEAAERYEIQAFDDPDVGRSFEFLTTDLGTGNPLVEAAALTVTQVVVDAGAGNDLLQGRILLDADWNLHLGDGDDIADIQTLIGDAFADARYRVDAGEGDNETTLRFGDGERGTRLPSGATNVTAEYRSGSGNDSVHFDWLVHLDRPLDIDLDASTGAGDDLVIASWKNQHESRTGKAVLWDHNFETGAGEDTVELRVAPGEGMDALGAEVKVDPADEPDDFGRVKVQFSFDRDGRGESRVGGAETLRLETGDGNDAVEVRYTLFHPDGTPLRARLPDLEVLTGAGDDVVRHELSHVVQQDGDRRPAEFHVEINTGAGDDFIDAVLAAPGPPNLPADLAIGIDLGTGADRLRFDWRGPLQDPAADVRVDLRVSAGGADAALPEVGDEVLVTFMNGDPDRPFVLGTVWNSQDAPQDDKHLEMSLASTSGRLAVSSVLSGGAARDEVQLSVDGLVGPKTLLNARVDLGTGADSMTIDLTGLEARSAKKLAPIRLDLHGGTGQDTLAVTGTDGNDWILLTKRAMVFVGQACVNFAGFESVQVDAGDGNDRVWKLGRSPRIDWLVDGGDGRDCFFAPFAGDNLTLFDFEDVKAKKLR